MVTERRCTDETKLHCRVVRIYHSKEVFFGVQCLQFELPVSNLLDIYNDNAYNIIL